MTLNKHTHTKKSYCQPYVSFQIWVFHIIYSKNYILFAVPLIFVRAPIRTNVISDIVVKKKLALVSFHVIFVYFLNQVKCRQTHSSGGKKGKMLMNILLNRFIFSCINFWFLYFVLFFIVISIQVSHFISLFLMFLFFLLTSKRRIYFTKEKILLISFPSIYLFTLQINFKIFWHGKERAPTQSSRCLDRNSWENLYVKAFIRGKMRWKVFLGGVRLHKQHPHMFRATSTRVCISDTAVFFPFSIVLVCVFVTG